MPSSSPKDRLFTPRTALYANLALVFTGSILATLAVIDLVTGAIVVAVGFAGVAVSLLARSAEPDAEPEGRPETDEPSADTDPDEP